MKHLLVFVLLFLTNSFIKAQRNYQAFDILNDSLIVPPNGIYINENIFIDDSEVMNSHYLEYLHFLAQDSSAQALINAYPDTNIFGSRHLNHLLKQKGEYYKKRSKKHIPINMLLHDEIIHEPIHAYHWWNYFSYHGMKHHPVVGISYEQALAYCKWRSVFVTHLFNEVLKQKNKYKKIQDKKIIFQFSLPEESVWETASKEQFEKSKSDSTILFHLKSRTFSNKNEPMPAFSNTPNKAEFYNLIGNVAEMISEKGKCKGGSYVHSIEESDPGKFITYSKPERWLGFRSACKVIIEKEVK